MCYKNMGNICFVNFFWGAPVVRKMKWGGPGQPAGLPMLMTTIDNMCEVTKNVRSGLV